MDKPEFAPETLAVRAGIERSQFNEHAEALYLTSSFVFDSAAQAAARFGNQEPGNIYSRFTNPTVHAFEQRLAAIEGAEACVATASGMAAILSCALGLLKAGDHVVASRSVFGATIALFNNILGRFGVETTWVELQDVDAWMAAVRPATRMFYLETPANPTMELVDLAALCMAARQRGIPVVVDNCFCTPILQRPLALGADLVVHSATKFLDGQGRVLGGAVLGAAQLLNEKILPILRTAGPTLSAFNAWVLLKGLETLKLRVEAQCASALALAQWLQDHPAVASVLYPGLPSHPQYALACRQQAAGGAVVTFRVPGGREAAWRVIDHCRLISITANLGDTKTTITHPATTTHGRISADERARAGIDEGMLRIAVGLEALGDLQADLQRGLSLVNTASQR
ncbi:MAG: O-succinylhomoserine sulfhydrylase [Pseudomonadota bacterium]|nr:O-succinylhomoserine sulfhydrylase [Pseudomonadota bacterium]